MVYESILKYNFEFRVYMGDFPPLIFEWIFPYIHIELPLTEEISHYRLHKTSALHEWKIVIQIFILNEKV
jgi:hypothetical protein